MGTPSFDKITDHAKKNKFAWLGVLGTPTAVVILLWFILGGYIRQVEANEKKIDTLDSAITRQTVMLEMLLQSKGLPVPPSSQTTQRPGNSAPVIKYFRVVVGDSTKPFTAGDTVYIPMVDSTLRDTL